MHRNANVNLWPLIPWGAVVAVWLAVFLCGCATTQTDEVTVKPPPPVRY